MRRCGSGSLALGALLQGCSLLLSGDYSGEDPATGADAGFTSDGAGSDADVGTPPRSDAAVDAPAEESGSPGPINVFPNGSFESPANCNTFWTMTGVVAQAIEDAHDGRYACRICSTTGGMETAFQYYPEFQGVRAGETWEARAWVRGVGAPRMLECRLRLWNQGQYLSQDVSGPKSIGTDWQELVVRGTMTAAGDKLDPYWLSFPAGPDECYDIDDIRVFRVSP